MSNILQTAIDLTDLFSDESQEGIIDGKIYKITNLITGKVYIGQTKRTIECRWHEHVSDAKYKILSYIHRSINKYGPENFKIEQIDSANTRAELNRKENDWIIKEDCISPNGYNLKSGGRCSGISEETRQKISKAHKGKFVSEETKAKMSEAGKNKAPPSAESRAKMSESSRGKIASKETRKKLSENISGRVWSHNPITLEEKRLNDISEIGDGFVVGRRPVSIETSAKIKEKALGRRWIHNPITFEERMIGYNDLIPEGFVLGMVCVYYYNPELDKCIKLKPNEEVPDGFFIGKRPYSQHRPSK